MKKEDDFKWYDDNDLRLPKNRYKHNIAQQGDTIEWTFPNDKNTPEHFRGNTFQAKVVVVNHKEKEYGVYAEYGQDYIGFNDCKIIKRK